MLGSSDRGRRHHVDEAAGVLVDEAHALGAGLGCDEHDHALVILVGQGLHLLQVVLKRQVGQDGAAHAALDAALEIVLEAILHHHVEIAHEHEWHVHLVLDGLELLAEVVFALVALHLHLDAVLDALFHRGQGHFTL